jgi:hypothetical protein
MSDVLSRIRRQTFCMIYNRWCLRSDTSFLQRSPIQLITSLTVAEHRWWTEKVFMRHIVVDFWNLSPHTVYIFCFSQTGFLLPLLIADALFAKVIKITTCCVQPFLTHSALEPCRRFGWTIKPHMTYQTHSIWHTTSFFFFSAEFLCTSWCSPTQGL